MTKQSQNEPDKENTEKKPRHQPNEDAVDEASQESFPASDAPGWSGTTASPKKPERGNSSEKK